MKPRPSDRVPPVSNPPVVLDASALLAVLRREKGADIVAAKLRGAMISTVNCAEVLQKHCSTETTAQIALATLAELEVQIVNFSVQHAVICASLLEPTKPIGLSLGDRSCLALGICNNAVVLTADGSWDSPLVTGVQLQLIR